MPPTLIQPQKSAVPTFYYIVFGIIEPLITFASLLEGIFDPRKVIVRHGRWSSGFAEAPGALPPTVRAVIYQMVVAHAIIGLVNASVLRAIRTLPSSALQEKIARSLVISLSIGDVLHLFGTFYGIGDVRWKAKDWPQALWLSVAVGIGLFIPRVCWLLGIGRYVATRDSRLDGKS
ncbi:hypothetical protein BDM02DRAFT_3183918 [Thelephora ganbajun]|uniref:Uncharacterized protein n=1 Tax=Thelephora ganbajun TaxID=370292 RepID=A0ACB6ZRN6_THEGA|nr:hypothetical protein BDM02DRAFT_3183918 [Thelephora ganbajun]